MRSIFHPEYFTVENDQTYDEAMATRKAQADKLMGMNARILQQDMAEVVASYNHAGSAGEHCRCDAHTVWACTQGKGRGGFLFFV